MKKLNKSWQRSSSAPGGGGGISSAGGILGARFVTVETGDDVLLSFRLLFFLVLKNALSCVSNTVRIC